jgi:hypothetical protein
MRPRFVGLTAAMAGTAPVKVRHCRWEAGVRELEPGGKGKRVHIPEMCDACQGSLRRGSRPHPVRAVAEHGGDERPALPPWEAGQQYPDMVLATEMDEINGDMPL